MYQQQCDNIGLVFGICLELTYSVEKSSWGASESCTWVGELCNQIRSGCALITERTKNDDKYEQTLLRPFKSLLYDIFACFITIIIIIIMLIILMNTATIDFQVVLKPAGSDATSNAKASSATIRNTPDDSPNNDVSS